MTPNSEQADRSTGQSRKPSEAQSFVPTADNLHKITVNGIVYYANPNGYQGLKKEYEAHTKWRINTMHTTVGSTCTCKIGENHE